MTTLSDKATRYLQLAGSFFAVAAVVYTLLLTTITGWADTRYVLKKELAQAVEEIKEATEDAAENASNRERESDIRDLEDDIVWFGEQDQIISAQRRCRKLTRIVRDWENQNDQRWQQDPIVSAVCGRHEDPV